MIRIPRLGHLGVFLLLFSVAFPFFGWPQVLWILFVIPIAAAWWVERTRTTVSAAGLDLRTAFGSRHIDWSQVRGLRIPKRGFVRVHLTDETASEAALPAVGYDRLKDLIAASGGRIPDPFATPATAQPAAAGVDAHEDTSTAADTTDTGAGTTDTSTPGTHRTNGTGAGDADPAKPESAG
ncbi:MAG: PH domain-containing protein [Stackebrandtia sp.]